ncbi:hypothetical protein BHE74_00046925 [Ensete ventricosum]|nr:hypothetical protein GW17_00022527 [Ensete ventricosum]RWW47111.1 hypothetical protein BHE74_00046925 [Ensete ventricosum]RZS19006.1 hypothetical protein BHM03_00051353 [Ensete ventricosum]
MNGPRDRAPLHQPAGGLNTAAAAVRVAAIIERANEVVRGCGPGRVLYLRRGGSVPYAMFSPGWSASAPNRWMSRTMVDLPEPLCTTDAVGGAARRIRTVSFNFDTFLGTLIPRFISPIEVHMDAMGVVGEGCPQWTPYKLPVRPAMAKRNWVRTARQLRESDETEACDDLQDKIS